MKCAVLRDSYSATQFTITFVCGYVLKTYTDMPRYKNWKKNEHSLLSVSYYWLEKIALTIKILLGKLRKNSPLYKQTVEDALLD